MKLKCPSCQTEFEADDTPAAGPGLILGEACCLEQEGVPAPPPPPTRGQRPRMPDISFAPRAPEPEGAPAAEVGPRSSERDPVSLDGIDVISGHEGPVVHDGGFVR